MLWRVLALFLLLFGLCGLVLGANKDPQLFYQNFESTPSGYYPLSAQTNSLCTALFGSYRGSVLASTPLYFGPVDANSQVDISLYSLGCSTSPTLTAKYYDGSAWQTAATFAASTSASFSSAHVSNVNTDLPGPLFRLETTQDSVIDELAIDCSNVPCDQASPHQVYQLDFDTASSTTEGQLISSSTSLFDCQVEGSQSLVMRTGSNRTKTLSSLNLASGGKLSFDLWMSTATNDSCINYTAYQVNNSYSISGYTTNGTCTAQDMGGTAKLWINEVSMRGRYDSSTGNLASEWQAPGAYNSGNGNPWIMQVNSSSYANFKGGIEIAGVAGTNISSYYLALIIPNC